MRLKRLELHGFKSFVDRTILHFQPGITGVVGPNGCGKSNIVDAILWVMGEQSAKLLRGDSMTDVIFSGSETKAPTSMAEVSLHLDKHGVLLAPQFGRFDHPEEISVTRRIYRDGTAEFFINKTPCRLRDIHELFMDTGVGRRSYSIIEQGQIDRMINSKPDERRLIFEEVAGITKYKSKKKEAEKKLELTRLNLSRLGDIIREIEKQLRSVKVQATRARKYKEFKDEVETIDLFLIGKKLFTLKQNIDHWESDLARLVILREEAGARLSSHEAGLTELEVTRIDREKEVQALSEKERALSLRIEKLESRLGLYQAERKHLVQTSNARQKEESELQTKNAALRAESLTIARENAEIGSSLLAIEMEIAGQEKSLHELQTASRDLNQTKEATRFGLSQASEEEVSLNNTVRHAQDRLAELQKMREEFNQKLTHTIELLSQHKERLKAVDQKIEGCCLRTQNGEKDLNVISTECEGLSRDLSGAEEKLFQAKEDFHSKNSRLESLRELQRNFEGYSPSSREVLLKLDTPISAFPVGEVLEPPPELEDHLEILLGHELHTLIVSTLEDAEILGRTIHEKALEHVEILAQTANQRRSNEVLVDDAPLLSRIRVKEGYERVAALLLGDVYLCDDLEQLFMHHALHPNLTFMTLDGSALFRRNGVLACGVLSKKSGIFARKREMEELAVWCEEMNRGVGRLALEREGLLRSLEAREKLHTEMKEKLSCLHVESVEYRKEKENIQLESARADRDYRELVVLSERNQSQLDAVRGQLDALVSSLKSVGERKRELSEELAGWESEISHTAHAVEEMVARTSERRIEKTKYEERRSGFNVALEKLKSEIELGLRHQAALDAQKMEEVNQLRRLAQQESDIQAQHESCLNERAILASQLSDCSSAYARVCDEIQQSREQREGWRNRKDTLSSDVQKCELGLTQQTSELERVRGLSVERYQKEAPILDQNANLDLLNVPLFQADLNVDWVTLSCIDKEVLLETHNQNLRGKIERYGEVNVTAIHEFDEIQNRYDFLMKQKTDLDHSILTLEEAIKKIDQTTQSRFEDTFESINAKFKEIFPILFNGGKAELRLTEPGSTVDFGVDIFVQPPGKQLQSIMLLSGGEKALTAVSLVLSIFSRKPSPFCLLDEVDAPLDDANVARFNTVVKHMATKSQFIVITHNKKTMEVADALYGVTMEKAGISNMTSVKLN